jgi:hypothetical protein
MKARTVPSAFANFPQRLAIVAVLGSVLPLAVRAQSDACPPSPSLRKALSQPYRSPAEISVGLT